MSASTLPDRSGSTDATGDVRKDTPLSNALSFDLEHWHSATLLQDEVDDPTDHIVDSVTTVLKILNRHDVLATFFIVGELANSYPELLQRVEQSGHEIASHGHTHTPLFDLTPVEFEAELRQSATAIERATGVKPRGFRAPNFSITRETAWAFDVLAASDYEYDSSVFPVRTPMYGVSGAPIQPYSVQNSDPFALPPQAQSLHGLVEYPLSVADRRLPLPIAGGFYARVLPRWTLKRGIEWLNNNGIPANIYFHPWEFNPNVRIDCSLPKRVISFTGIEKTESKLEYLLSSSEFGPVGTVLEERSLLARSTC